jgi:hypothetical protein
VCLPKIWNSIQCGIKLTGQVYNSFFPRDTVIFEFIEINEKSSRRSNLFVLCYVTEILITVVLYFFFFGFNTK